VITFNEGEKLKKKKKGEGKREDDEDVQQGGVEERHEKRGKLHQKNSVRSALEGKEGCDWSGSY